MRDEDLWEAAVTQNAAGRWGHPSMGPITSPVLIPLTDAQRVLPDTLVRGDQTLGKI